VPPGVTSVHEEPLQVSAAPLEASLAKLARSLRVLKIWLVVLSVAIAGLVAAVVVLEVTRDDTPAPDYVGETYRPTEQQAVDARAEIEHAFGDKLESVAARIVQVDLPAEALVGAPEGSMPPPVLYVEYRLKGFDIPIAGTVEEPYSSVSSAALIPTRGSLSSRMSSKQFDALLRAYGEATSAPFGGVRRYGDSAMEMPGQVVADTIRSGGRTYRTDELWTVRQGALAEGDSISIEDSAYSEGTMHVFREDPKTGEFTYLGTESGMWW
jgi:hypothetical protein